MTTVTNKIITKANRGLARMTTQASNGCQAAIFWDNFLWHTLDQNEANNVHSLSTG